MEMQPPDAYQDERSMMGPQGQLQIHQTKDTYDSLAQFLHHDRRVLRYYALAQLPEYPHGKHGKKKFIICFYLADNSIEVRDVRDTGDNKGEFVKANYVDELNLIKVLEVFQSFSKDRSWQRVELVMQMHFHQ